MERVKASLLSLTDGKKKLCRSQESGVGTERNKRKWLALETPPDLENGSSSIAPASLEARRPPILIRLAYCSAVFSRSMDQINIT